MTRKRKLKHKTGKPARGTVLGFPGELEDETKELYDLACRGAEPLLLQSNDSPVDMQDPEFRRTFYVAAHNGFRGAQDRVLSRMLGAEEVSGAAETLYRKAMDAIAWQMLSEQLYIARRVYRGQSQPSPKHANLESTREAAQWFMEEDEARFALLSDLTTFVQLGDLLTMDPNEGIGFVEVKEGATNKKVMEFAKFMAQSRCERAVYFFRQQEGEKTFRQLGRVLRQQSRMAHVSQILNTDKGVDPDTGHRVVIPSDPLPLDSWDDELMAVLAESRDKGWAISHIDRCLFVGAYRGVMRVAGQEAFKIWFSHTAGTDKYPRTNLLQCMKNPLALPIFSRHIPREDKFDLLFGRAVVLLGLDIGGFMELCKELGIDARWSTRKEAGRLRQTHPSLAPWVFDNRVLMVGRGDRLGAMSDGIFLRIFFHGTRPASAADILASVSEMVDEEEESTSSHQSEDREG